MGANEAESSVDNAGSANYGGAVSTPAGGNRLMSGVHLTPVK